LLKREILEEHFSGEEIVDKKIADTKKFCKEKSEIFAEKRYC